MADQMVLCAGRNQQFVIRARRACSTAAGDHMPAPKMAFSTAMRPGDHGEPVFTIMEPGED